MDADVMPSYSVGLRLCVARLVPMNHLFMVLGMDKPSCLSRHGRIGQK